MELSEIIQTLLRQDQGHPNKPIFFRPGQIVSGKIIKLFPNQMAEVQFGSQKAVAQLEMPLSANNRYWFNVHSGEGIIHLKVIESLITTDKNSPAESLLNQLNLPVTKENKMLVQFFLKEQLPITDEILKQASEWLKEIESFKDGLQAVKELLLRQLPFTNGVFKALSSVMPGDSLSELMESLLRQLKQSELTVIGQKAVILLKQLTKIEGEKDGEAAARLAVEWLRPDSQPNSLAGHLRNLIQALGLTYEYDLIKYLKSQDERSAGKLDTLKPLLIGLLSEEMPSAAKDTAERLLHKITGFQVLSQEAGPLQHFVFQLPVALGDKVSDLTMQWSGKKTESGEIDPNYCRVLFYLNLEHLKETIIDLHVQNRIINISIINENDMLKALAAPLAGSLKEELAKLEYKLSSISFQKPERSGFSLKEKQPVSPFVQANQFTGVDLRI